MNSQINVWDARKDRLLTYKMDSVPIVISLTLRLINAINQQLSPTLQASNKPNILKLNPMIPLLLFRTQLMNILKQQDFSMYNAPEINPTSIKLLETVLVAKMDKHQTLLQVPVLFVSFMMTKISNVIHCQLSPMCQPYNKLITYSSHLNTPRKL